MHHSIEEGRPLEDHSEKEELSPEDSTTEANHTPQTPDLEPVLYAEKRDTVLMAAMREPALVAEKQHTPPTTVNISLLLKIKQGKEEVFSLDGQFKNHRYRALHRSNTRTNSRHQTRTLTSRRRSMLYALCSMLYALCSMLYALCSMLYALCSMLYALCSMLYALCSMLYTLYSMHSIIIEEI